MICIIYLTTVHLFLFADDAKIFSIIDAIILHLTLDKLINWSHDNYQNLNVNKCNIIYFTHSRNYTSTIPNIDNLRLARVTFSKDLGILFDHNVFFSILIN